MPDLDELKLDAEERMEKAVNVVSDNLAKIRTGRANTSLLDHIQVDYYGALTPLNQLASLSTPDARSITIQPFDPGSTPLIEKAIMQSDLGLTPNTSGEGQQRMIRIILPDLSEDRRRDLVKVAKQDAEDGRIAIRNIRRDANETLKSLAKDSEIGEDDSRREQEEIQKLTDQYVQKIDTLVSAKEQDLMKV